MRVAVDTGGTFTDAIAWDGTRLAAVKVPAARDEPARSVVEAVRRLEGTLARQATVVVVGTTVATNALLERRGARVGLVTSAGFEDVLRIGRQDRPDLYALDVPPPEPLVRAGDVAGAAGLGVAPDALSWAELGAVAVCLVRAPEAPEEEALVAKRVGELLCASGNATARVVSSMVVLPELREFERTSTTVVDAYVGGAIAHFLRGIARGLGETAAGAPTLRVQASDGGNVMAARALDRPVVTVLSGPAGGVLAAAQLCEREGIETAIAMDVGGTSTDVALVRRAEGGVAWTTDGVVAGVPIALPMVEVHTIGAGGGSIVRTDAAGALRVGPESAGAVPGPAAYGLGGGYPTLTDCHVVLGRLDASVRGAFGTGVTLDARLAWAALEPVAQRLGVGPRELAGRACEAAELAMARAVRRVSVERGVDPRVATLVAFGGGGGLHAGSVAALLGIRRVRVPGLAGVLSAAGILAAPPSRVLGRGVIGRDVEAVSTALRRAAAEASSFLESEGVPDAERRLEAVLEVRYRSQTSAVPLRVDLSWCDPRRAAEGLRELEERFRRAHCERFGFDLEREIEVVAVRVRASGAALDVGASRPRETSVDAVRVNSSALRRADLVPGSAVAGPAVITDAYGTTFVPDRWVARTDERGDMELNPT